MDSVTALYWAREHYDRIHALTFDYGQMHQLEIGSAQRIAMMAGVATHEVLLMGGLLASASPLVDHSRPLETYPDFETMATLCPAEKPWLASVLLVRRTS